MNDGNALQRRGGSGGDRKDGVSSGQGAEVGGRVISLRPLEIYFHQV
jgi:hypothetical protein